MTTKELVEYANALQARHGDNAQLAVFVMDIVDVKNAYSEMGVTDEISQETVDLILSEVEETVNDHVDNTLVELLTDYLPDDAVDVDFEE